ncbi:MAG: hypothetical protein ABJA35_01140 [Parafilimonas sp.]
MLTCILSAISLYAISVQACFKNSSSCSASLANVVVGFYYLSACWEWASNDAGAEPDVVMACAGDVQHLKRWPLYLS